MTTDTKMALDDVVTFKNGEKFSDTWYCEVFRKLFRPRRCDRCGETVNTLGAFLHGKSTHANNAIFGYTVEAAERIIKTLDLNSWCEPCYLKLRFNGTGPPLKWSELRDLKKKEGRNG